MWTRKCPIMKTLGNRNMSVHVNNSTKKIYIWLILTYIDYYSSATGNRLFTSVTVYFRCREKAGSSELICERENVRNAKVFLKIYTMGTDKMTYFTKTEIFASQSWLKARSPSQRNQKKNENCVEHSFQQKNFSSWENASRIFYMVLPSDAGILPFPS